MDGEGLGAEEARLIPLDEAQAVRAAVAVGRSLGLRVDAPVVLASGYAVRVHLAPSPYVARVPTWTSLVRKPIEPWLTRELDVTRFLANAGAPVVAPAMDVDPGPHHAPDAESTAVSLWQLVQTKSDVAPTQQEFGRMLGELHAVLRTYEGDLPLLAPPANDIPAAMERIAEHRRLPQEDYGALRRAWERLAPALEHPTGELQPLHGDAHPGNLIATDRGLLWNDFEDVCRGPIAWDMASLLLSEEAIAAYPSPPPHETREIYRDIRRLHVVTWLLALEWEFESRDRIIADLVGHFLNYRPPV